MLTYEVLRYSYDIAVNLNAQEFLKVVRKRNMFGTLISKFYKNEALLFEITYRSFFFKSNYKIKFQDFESPVSLIKPIRKRFFEKIINLVYKSSILSINFRIFKGPLFILKRDDAILGEVFAKRFSFKEKSVRYEVRFIADDEANFYALLLLIAMLAKDYDVIC